MTEKASSAVDLQDPLPESSYFYRRIYAGLVTLACLGIVAYAVWGITDSLVEVADGDGNVAALAHALRSICLYLICFIAAVATYYMVAPSAEHVVKVFQTVRMNLGGAAGAARSIGSAATTAGRSIFPPSRSRGSDFDAAPTSRGRNR